MDMAEVEKDEVPGNPYRVQEDVEVENTVLDDAVEIWSILPGLSCLTR